jgi:hypothetical protein
MDFDVTDKINGTIERTPDVEPALADFKDYIAGQTLSQTIELADSPADAIEVEMDKTVLKIAVKNRQSKIVHRSSFIVPFIVHRSSFIVHRSSFIVHRSSFIVPFIVHRSSFIVHRSSFIVHRSSFIVHRQSRMSLNVPTISISSCGKISSAPSTMLSGTV